MKTLQVKAIEFHRIALGSVPEFALFFFNLGDYVELCTAVAAVAASGAVPALTISI